MIFDNPKPALLQTARLWYGTSFIDVTPSAELPIPMQFDFDNHMLAARHILAVMSFASGGHQLRECRLNIHVGRRTVSIVANGAAVHYAPAVRTPLTAKDAIRVCAETARIDLGTVSTPYGWRRAAWTATVAA